MNRWAISRRTFLRGAGAALALPALEAMAPSLARAQEMGEPPPRRILAYYVPNGIHMRAWTPAQTGDQWELTPILAPLAAVKSDLLVVSNVSNLPARPDGPGDHASGTGAFLTASHPFKTEGTNIQNGISMDQVAATAIGSRTLFPSLQLGAEGGGSTGNCDSGYSCAYARNISWAGPQTPLAKEVNPSAVFDRLFSGFDPEASGEQIRKRKLYKLSILDFVREDASRLKVRLGKTDQRKMDEYLTAVRELETRIRAQEEAPLCDPGTRPEGGGDVRARVRNMSDLMVLAFKCDLTRVITFMLGNAGSNRVYDFLGIGEGHHQISHHQDMQANFEMLQTIDTWEIEQLAYLLQALKRETDADGTPILDNTVVFFSSEIEDGNSHSHRSLPILLAGKGGGLLRTGRHVRFGSEQKIADLFIALLRTVGVEVSSFGDDGTSPLSL
jgi:hypothetical protein